MPKDFAEPISGLKPAKEIVSMDWGRRFFKLLNLIYNFRLKRKR